jgi:hypothetical protein
MLGNCADAGRQQSATNSMRRISDIRRFIVAGLLLPLSAALGGINGADELAEAGRVRRGQPFRVPISRGYPRSARQTIQSGGYLKTEGDLPLRIRTERMASWTYSVWAPLFLLRFLPRGRRRLVAVRIGFAIRLRFSPGLQELEPVARSRRGDSHGVRVHPRERTQGETRQNGSSRSPCDSRRP